MILSEVLSLCLDLYVLLLMGDFPDWQKVVKCTNYSAELLQQRTSDAASNALTIITEALSISSYSEKLLKMKGEALCMVCLIKFLHVFLSFSLLISSLLHFCCYLRSVLIIGFFHSASYSCGSMKRWFNFVNKLLDLLKRILAPWILLSSYQIMMVLIAITQMQGSGGGD